MRIIHVLITFCIFFTINADSMDSRFKILDSVKEIVDGKADDQNDWKIYYQYNIGLVGGTDRVFIELSVDQKLYDEEKEYRVEIERDRKELNKVRKTITERKDEFHEKAIDNLVKWRDNNPEATKEEFVKREKEVYKAFELREKQELSDLLKREVDLHKDIKNLETRQKELKQMLNRQINERRMEIMSKRELISLVTCVFVNSKKEPCDPKEISPLINALAAQKNKVNKNDFQTQNASIRNDFPRNGFSCALRSEKIINGIAVVFYRNGTPIYLLTFSPENEFTKEIFTGGNIPVIELIYAPNKSVKDVDYVIVNRNKRIEDEIEKSWKNLNIGVWSDRYPYSHGDSFYFMPMGMKENMCSIQEFVVVSLNSNLSEIKQNNNTIVKTIEKYKKLLKQENSIPEDQLSKFECAKERYENVRLPYEKRVEAKLNYFKNKLKK